MVWEEVSLTELDSKPGMPDSSLAHPDPANHQELDIPGHEPI